MPSGEKDATEDKSQPESCEKTVPPGGPCGKQQNTRPHRAGQKPARFGPAHGLTRHLADRSAPFHSTAPVSAAEAPTDAAVPFRYDGSESRRDRITTCAPREGRESSRFAPFRPKSVAPLRKNGRTRSQGRQQADPSPGRLRACRLNGPRPPPPFAAWHSAGRSRRPRTGFARNATTPTNPPRELNSGLAGRRAWGTGRRYGSHSVPSLCAGLATGSEHITLCAFGRRLPHLSFSRRCPPLAGTPRHGINVAQSADMLSPAAALSRGLLTRPPRSGGAGPAPACRHPPCPPTAAYNIWRGSPNPPPTPDARPLHPQGAALTDQSGEGFAASQPV